MILHAVGDTIGYKNGHWEFMYSLDKVYEFIDLGGINHLSLKDWRVSDDTIFHMKNAEALLEDFNSINKLCEIVTKKYIKAFDQFTKETYNFRNPGITTLTSVEKLKNGRSWDKTPYNFLSGGSGVSMRNSCIGLAFYGEKNRNKLIQIAIETGRITHNSTIGYLGGLVSALFTAYAVEKVPIKEWVFKFIKLYDDGVIDQYIKSAGRDVDNYNNDVHIFMDKWRQYVQDKFDANKEIIKRRSNINLSLRSEYYYNNYSYKQIQHGKQQKFPGSGGDDSVIIAYDCLLDAGNSWEKLIFYAMLHIGDTDTTGCIAGSWWGITKGFEDIPKINLEFIEYKKELEKLGKDLFKKYHK